MKNVLKVEWFALKKNPLKVRVITCVCVCVCVITKSLKTLQTTHGKEAKVV